MEKEKLIFIGTISIFLAIFIVSYIFFQKTKPIEELKTTTEEEKDIDKILSEELTAPLEDKDNKRLEEKDVLEKIKEELTAPQGIAPLEVSEDILKQLSTPE
ncbi:MAG TPA: hypothetical protein QGH92_02610 [Candidatus Parcubacteria bacterium]|jgi:hypothetical protein|nr:hypothetical protein [Candidatus Parcubacteria bacterium]|tara:strand:+ start:1323 stop:1628 length:306 start_codon:yes stop_codon:yes gene_type:complete